LIQLKDPEWQTRLKAAKNLGRVKEKRIVKPLIQALNDENPKVRAYAVRSLALTKDPEGLAPIIERLDDPDPFVRKKVIEHLQLYFDDEVVEAFKRSLDDSDILVKAEAARKMYSLLSGYVDAVKDHVPEFREALMDTDLDVKARILCAETLGTLQDKESFDSFVTLIEDEDQQLREAGTIALGKLRDPRSFFILLELMKEVDKIKSETSFVALYAVNALKDLEDPRTIDYLLPYLLHEPDLTLIPSTVEALSMAPDMWSHFPVKFRILFPVPAPYIGEKGESRVTVPVAKTMVDYPSDNITGTCAVALKRIGDDRAVPYLKLMLGKSQKWVIKRVLEEALKSLEGNSEHDQKPLFE
jgi:HEAT repeat protein